MAKPCGHQEFRETCRICYLDRNDPAYHKLFENLPAKRRMPMGKADKPRISLGKPQKKG